MGGGRGRHPARFRVKKPQPEICESYLMQWYGGDLYRNPERFPRLSSATLFGNDNPLEVEIGCASGEFLISHASMRPETNFLGIDRAQKPLFCAINNSVKIGCTNIKFIRNDALLLLPLFPAASIRRIYFHFPIPVLLNKHNKHKVFSAQFLDTIAELLVNDGLVSVMTDNEEYATIMEEIGRSDTRFAVDKDPALYPSIDPPERSYYHKLWLRKGRQEFRFVLRKNAQKLQEQPCGL